MRKACLIVLLLILAFNIIKDIKDVSKVKELNRINQEIGTQCSIDTESNEYLICD